jgi:hypothetical protein
MRAIWNNPLGREIVLILVVKIVAVFAIWWVFFRPIGAHPQLDANQVSAAMISKQQTVAQPTITQPATRSRQDD